MKKINYYIIIYMFLFSIIPITCLEIFAPKLCDIIKLISVGIMSIYIMLEIIKTQKIDKFDLLLIINSLLLIIISIINRTITINNTFAMISLFVVPCFIRKIVGKSDKALQALYYTYIIIIILNLITVFFKIEINNQYYFYIGGKNAVSLTIVPAMLIIYLYSMLKYKRMTIFNSLMTIICIFMLMISKSTTAMIVAIIIIAKICISLLKKKTNNNNNNNKTSFKKCAIIYLIIFIIIVFIMPLIQETYINTLVEKIFDKNLTFTNRANLWNASYESFLKSPVIGYGKNNKIIYNYTGGRLDQSHNMLLELLLTGGILAFISFYMITYEATKKLKIHIKIDRAIIFYLFLYAIIGLVESIIFCYQLWMIIGIACSVREMRLSYDRIEDINIKRERL